MAKIAERMRGPLKEEILITLHEIRMGKTRATALRAMADRCQVDDLTTFITALIQSQQLGISLGQVLRVQSEQIRTIQRQRIEERAQKAPVKLPCPTAALYLPGDVRRHHRTGGHQYLRRAAELSARRAGQRTPLASAGGQPRCAP